MQPGTERGARQPAARDLGHRAGFPATVEDGDRADGEGGSVDVGAARRDGEPLGCAEGAAEGAADGAQPDQAAGRTFLLRDGRRKWTSG